MWGYREAACGYLWSSEGIDVLERERQGQTAVELGSTGTRRGGRGESRARWEEQEKEKERCGERRGRLEADASDDDELDSYLSNEVFNLKVSGLNPDAIPFVFFEKFINERYDVDALGY